MTARKKPAPKPVPELPPDVKSADLEYVKFEEQVTLPGAGWVNSLTFYKTKGFGWVICTLQISSGRHRYRPSNTARTYGIGIDGKLCRVGHGPHVETVVEVHLSKSNIERLQKYVDLWVKGLEDANVTRDRISTRRARGYLRGW